MNLKNQHHKVVWNILFCLQRLRLHFFIIHFLINFTRNFIWNLLVSKVMHLHLPFSCAWMNGIIKEMIIWRSKFYFDFLHLHWYYFLILNLRNFKLAQNPQIALIIFFNDILISNPIPYLWVILFALKFRLSIYFR